MLIKFDLGLQERELHAFALRVANEPSMVDSDDSDGKDLRKKKKKMSPKKKRKL